MATGANVTVYFVKETTPGVTPTTPAWKPVGYKADSLKREQPVFQSERMRGDRMNAPSVNGVPKVSGEIATELVYGEQDDLIAGVFGQADWTLNKVKVGKVDQSFSILEKMDGVSGKMWRIYRGCVVNSLAWNIEASSIITANYGFVGTEAEMLDAAPEGSTFGTPSQNTPMTGLIGTVNVDGAPYNQITSISLNIDNGADIRPVVGSNKSLPITLRNSTATGNMTLYYENSAMAEKAQTEERLSMEFVFSDGADAASGNRYKITATKVKPSDAWPTIEGADDIMMPVTVNYEPDSATGTHITIERIAKGA